MLYRHCSLPAQFLLYIFWDKIYQIYVSTDVTASVVTYLQYENNHITFVMGINTLHVFISRPKSFLCIYASTNTPINVL
jgi:hypothetical protein